jgi:hypothetical protein
MEQPTNEAGTEPVDGSETPKANPEQSRSPSMPELLEKMRKLGWQVNPGEFSAIFVPVGGGEAGPDEEQQ